MVGYTAPVLFFLLTGVSLLVLRTGPEISTVACPFYPASLILFIVLCGYLLSALPIYGFWGDLERSCGGSRCTAVAMEIAVGNLE